MSNREPLERETLLRISAGNHSSSAYVNCSEKW